MTAVRMSHTRIVSEGLLDFADVELVDTLRLLLKEARRKGPFTLADIKSLTLEIDDGFPKGIVQIQFRMDKEVAP